MNLDLESLFLKKQTGFNSLIELLQNFLSGEGSHLCYLLVRSLGQQWKYEGGDLFVLPQLYSFMVLLGSEV